MATRQEIIDHHGYRKASGGLTYGGFEFAAFKIDRHELRYHAVREDGDVIPVPFDLVLEKDGYAYSRVAPPLDGITGVRPGEFLYFDGEEVSKTVPAEE